MDEIMLKVDNVSKMYKLGQIGGTTLRDELQRLGAKLRHKEDPTQIIGAKSHAKNETFMALNGVSFEVRRGERVGIIGHNGAGKSTLLKLISRITAPTGGTISMNGRVASMLEVGTGFNGELTGRENIYMNGAILGMTKKEIDAKMEDIIEFSECRQFIDTPVKRYSSGMYVKLAFSVAAHLDSEIMIMDEVLAVGDMAFQKKCLDKMNEVSRDDGRTILYVSHNMDTIRQLCTQVIVLNHGTVQFVGGVEQGIEAYSKVSHSDMVDKNFENVPRPNNIIQQFVKIHRIRILNDTTALRLQNELNLSFRYHCAESVSHLALRVEVHKLDGVGIASGVYPDFCSCIQGSTEEKQVSLSVGSLAPGYYELFFILFLISPSGTEQIVDYVRGMFFEILHTPGELIWKNQYWGNVRLTMK